jgi:hypothetical protein
VTSDVFYLRPLDPPATPEAVIEAGRQAGGCFNLHRVEWASSFLAADGRRMLCWYRAPDAESARLALRELGADMGGVWPGRLLKGNGPGDPAMARVEVLAELALDGTRRDDASLLGEIVRAVDGNAELACAVISSRGDRMVCLLGGGEAEAIGSGLAARGFAGARAWPCHVVAPAWHRLLPA